MLLETIKSLLARFIVDKPPREEIKTPPSLLHPHSTDTQSPVGTLSGASVSDSNAHLPLPASNPQIQTFAVPDAAPTSSFFENAHDMVINNPTIVSNTFDYGGGAIMQLLESKTIQGAEHDSSARYPPPKCHPDTRQSLRALISDWVVNPKRDWRMFYVLGHAGVGKSAVAQTVADDCKEVDCLGASCFISRPNHRNDPDGVIPTLAFQLAVKHAVYKRIISQKLAHDPTILRKTRRVQFKELLVDPFHIIMTQHTSTIHKPLLIIIDGLDECESQTAQCEFIEFISDHVRSFPDFPLLWLICSRPEWHLKYAMSQADFQVTCRREEMSVDDEEGRRDVLIYLRNEFRNIRLKYPCSLDCDWPPEVQLQRIAGAASGLFAFASTIIRFIDDADAGDPSSRLRVCIKILEGSNMPGVDNPYSTLDLLYRHILSSIPSKVLPTAMRIVGMSTFYPHQGPSVSARKQANFLRIGMVAFDHAVKQLHSILRIGSSPDDFDDPIEFYHASFGDFLKDSRRSGDFCLDEAAIHRDLAFSALRWHTNLAHEDDIWISSSENIQSCLESIKSQSLVVLWKACSRVEGKDAKNLYTEFQRFDFNVLLRTIPSEWGFGNFLSWFNQQQQRGFLTRKLLKIQYIPRKKDCSKIKFTNATVLQDTISGFATGDFEVLKTTHLDLGNGSKCRHMHITPVTPSEEELRLSVREAFSLRP